MNEPEDHEIDITIEAVTGTVYDLCVSPFETILGIKTKIQRLEGIPVYQQHLIYGDTELEDEYCLAEYHICTGCQLKLVVALRGGPVHAHRIQLEDSALLELAEYLDDQSGIEHEQYMFMLLNDGNVELVNADSRSQLQSPVDLLESRQSCSQTSLLAPPQPRLLTLAENMNTRDKMRDIQTKLKTLRLNRAEHQIPKKSSTLNKRKCTAKVIILDSRASSRVHISPSPATPPQPSSRLCSTNPPCCCLCTCQHHHCHNCHNLSAKSQRKLVFRPHHSNSKLKNNRSTSRESCCQPKLLADIAEQAPPPAPPLNYNSKRHRKLKPLPSNVSNNNSSFPTLLSDHHKSSADIPSGSSSSSRSGSRLLKGVNCERGHHKRTAPAPESSSTTEHFLPPIITKRSMIERNPSDLFQQKSNKKNRCMKCGKKTRLAATYTCRCGGLFCGAHRYAETHCCTFDYKSEGKQTIARNNPLVVATKLPKI